MKREMIPCHVVLERLWAFLDGELEPASEEEVREHLAMCRMCYPRYDFQRAYFQLMRRLSDRPEPRGLGQKVFSLLLDEEAAG